MLVENTCLGPCGFGLDFKERQRPYPADAAGLQRLLQTTIKGGAMKRIVKAKWSSVALVFIATGVILILPNLS